MNRFLDNGAVADGTAMATSSLLSVMLTIFLSLTQHLGNVRATSRHGHYDLRTTASSTKTTTSSAANGRRHYAVTRNPEGALSHRRNTSSSRSTSTSAPYVDYADIKNEHVISKLKSAWQHIVLSVTARTAPCTENISRCTSPTYRKERQLRTNDVKHSSLCA